jgi:TolA-binding protein
MRLFLILCLIFPLLGRAEDEQEALFLRRIADFWQEGEYQIAKTQMEEFVEDYPESPFSDALCAALGDLFLREKNYSNALNYYSQVQSSEFVQKVFLNRMQCLYEMQWYATLADECEAYLETAPNIQVTYFLAVALYHQCINTSKESEQLLKLAERAKPYFETLYQSELSQEVAQGYAHLSCILKDYGKATEIYIDLANKNPKMEEDMLFQVALIQSEYDKVLSLTTFDQIRKIGGQRAKEATYNRMVLAFELGRFEDLTEDELTTQVPLDRIGSMRLLLGRSLLQLQRYPEAAQELNAYIENAPVSETLFAALLSLLDASYRSDDLDLLEKATQKLATLYPDHPELPKAYFSRAQLLKRAERFEMAKLELEKLLERFPAFAQRPQVLFELTHLGFKSKNWEECYQKGLEFLNAFHDQELAPFVWRYFVASSSEIALKNLAHRPQLIKDLMAFLKHPLEKVEKEEWELLLAKTHYELKQYKEAMSVLENEQTANAKLLLALCYRDGSRDTQMFCTLAEEALLKGANLVDLGQIHASLYNGYLELENIERAAQHLYESFMAKAELKEENLLWLANYYYTRVLEEESNFVIAARSAALFDRLKRSEETVCKLAKLYSILGKIDEAIQLIEKLDTPSSEAQLILAENYVKKGIVDQAGQIFDAIVSVAGTGRSPIAAAATLHSARLKMANKEANLTEIATQLKNLVIQKNFEGEPFYLEAALDYVALQSKGDLAKRIALLKKTKEDFESRDDLLSKDYHAARENSPRKNMTYQGYMKFIEAQIALNEAKIDLSRQKDLQAKGKTLLLQIGEMPIASCLKIRVQKLLADEK